MYTRTFLAGVVLSLSITTSSTFLCLPSYTWSMQEGTQGPGISPVSFSSPPCVIIFSRFVKSKLLFLVNLNFTNFTNCIVELQNIGADRTHWLKMSQQILFNAKWFQFLVSAKVIEHPHSFGGTRRTMQYRRQSSSFTFKLKRWLFIYYCFSSIILIPLNLPHTQKYYPNVFYLWKYFVVHNLITLAKCSNLKLYHVFYFPFSVKF